MPSTNIKTLAVVATLGGALALALFVGIGGRAKADTEEPSYRVESKDGDIEVRAYEPMLMAVTDVEGSYDDAISAGFRRIAGFIFGDNVSQDKVAMTAPVSAEPKSQKIDMTAPVTATSGEAGTWRISFMMPSEYTRDTLPVPTDNQVEIVEIPGRRLAVLSFSGSIMGEVPTEEIERLEGWMRAQGLTPAGPAVIAQFDPPWKLWFMRRNEVQIPIQG